MGGGWLRGLGERREKLLQRAAAVGNTAASTRLWATLLSFTSFFMEVIELEDVPPFFLVVLLRVLLIFFFPPAAFFCAPPLKSKRALEDTTGTLTG